MFRVNHREKFNLLIALGATMLVFVFKIVLFSHLKTGGIWESLIFSVACFFILPFFLIRLVFAKRVPDYNLRFQIIKKNAIWTILAIVLLASVVAFCVVKYDWDKFLVVSNWIIGGKGVVFFIDLILLPIMVFFQDFFFRGFLFKSLNEHWNEIVSILVVSFFYVAFSYLGDRNLIGLRFAFLFLVNIFLTVIAKLNRSIFLSAFLMWAYLFSIDLIVLQRISEVGQ